MISMIKRQPPPPSVGLGAHFGLACDLPCPHQLGHHAGDQPKARGDQRGGDDKTAIFARQTLSPCGIFGLVYACVLHHGPHGDRQSA